MRHLQRKNDDLHTAAVAVVMAVGVVVFVVNFVVVVVVLFFFSFVQQRALSNSHSRLPDRRSRDKCWHQNLVSRRCDTAQRTPGPQTIDQRYEVGNGKGTN